jgi:hypothetical protein
MPQGGMCGGRANRMIASSNPPVKLQIARFLTLLPPTSRKKRREMGHPAVQIKSARFAIANPVTLCRQAKSMYS